MCGIRTWTPTCSEFRLEEGAPKRRYGATLTHSRERSWCEARPGTVRSDLTPCPGRYRFWVTSSCLALRGIPRSHCAFVRQLVRPGPDVHNRQPPVVGHFSPWKLRGTYGDDSWKKGHHEPPPADDDAGTGNVRREWKWSEGDDARCRVDVDRRDNRNRLRSHYSDVLIEAGEYRLPWLTVLTKLTN